MLEFIVLGLVPGTNIQLTFSEVMLVSLVLSLLLWIAVRSRTISHMVRSGWQAIMRLYPVIALRLSSTLSRLV